MLFFIIVVLIAHSEREEISPLSRLLICVLSVLPCVWLCVCVRACVRLCVCVCVGVCVCGLCIVYFLSRGTTLEFASRLGQWYVSTNVLLSIYLLI